jgi:hypothetical protein
MARRTELRFPRHTALVDPLEVYSSELTLDDNRDVEEFPLLLQPDEVRELIAAARQEGLSAAGLARYLIRDYLLWTRSDFGKALGRQLRRWSPGDER